MESPSINLRIEECWGILYYRSPVNVYNVVLSNEYAEDKPPFGISERSDACQSKKGAFGHHYIEDKRTELLHAGCKLLHAGCRTSTSKENCSNKRRILSDSKNSLCIFPVAFDGPRPCGCDVEREGDELREKVGKAGALDEDIAQRGYDVAHRI